VDILAGHSLSLKASVVDPKFYLVGFGTGEIALHPGQIAIFEGVQNAFVADEDRHRMAAVGASQGNG
jgi:hypothetical protein